MKEEIESRPNHRPNKEIDWEIVDKYLKSQCDGVGIAAILGVHPDTLYLRCVKDHEMTFSAYSQQKKSEGKELLRAKQFETALNGEKTMLVWLGKQYLNQADKSENINQNTNIEKLDDKKKEETISKIKDILKDDDISTPQEQS